MIGSRLAASLFTAGLLVAPWHTSAETTAQPKRNDATRCAALTDPSGRLQIDQQHWVAESQQWAPTEASSYEPVAIERAFCRVSGRIEGNIGLELWLPAQAHWNQRLLGAGVGGDAGVYNYTDMGKRLNEGFVTFSTNSGHRRDDNNRWMANPKARQDYTHRAVHQATVHSKALLQQFYGQPQQHSYFLGCSGGGRQALKEMQHYPADFDGVIAGAPAPYMPLQSVRMMWSALLQKHQPNAALTEQDWSVYEQRVTQQCDGLDGVEDGIIENLARCEFNIDSLRCGASGAPSHCLSAEKADMLSTIVNPMPDHSGQPMDFGLFPGVRTRPGPPSPLLRAMWADGVYNDAHWDEDSFDRERDLQSANHHMPELRADDPMIDAFLARNGKAIIYQGWSDPSTVAGLAIDYYRTLHQRYSDLDESVRLFLAPGMYHCRRGPGADHFGGSRHLTAPGEPERDILWAMIEWVENHRAPARLTATKLNDGAVQLTRTLCPFPQAAYFTGGDDRQASSFICRDDDTLVDMLQVSP